MSEQAKKNLIVVTFSDGQTTALDAERGDWTAYDYDGVAFIVRNGKVLAGLYNFAHVRSIEIKASAKEDAPNV